MTNEKEKLQDEQKEKLIDYWVRSAEYDLGVSESLYEKRRFHYSLFFGHLAIEKILKAIFVKKKSIHAPFSHSLTYLVGKAGIEIQHRKGLKDLPILWIFTSRADIPVTWMIFSRNILRL